MAKKTYTQEDIEKARAALESLPDLSRQKLGQAEALAELKDQIILLSSTKGYSTAEIKSALAQVGIQVTTKAIAEVIATRKRGPGRKKSDSENGDTTAG